MSNTYQIYLISDSTGETLDRIFLALKAQFNSIKYKIHPYSFTRTENQISKILEVAENLDEQNKLGENARRLAEAEFNENKIAEKLVAIFKTIQIKKGI